MVNKLRVVWLDISDEPYLQNLLDKMIMAGDFGYNDERMTQTAVSVAKGATDIQTKP